MGLFVLIVAIMAILSSVVLFSLWLVVLVCLVVAMAKMASLEAEQREVPRSFYVWRAVKVYAFVAMFLAFVVDVAIIYLVVTS